MQCVHGAHLCAETVCRASVGILSVLRLCAERVWVPVLCSGCGQKVPPVLRLCDVRVWVPALCSGCGQKCTPTVLRLFVLFVFPAGRMRHPPVDEKRKTSAALWPLVENDEQSDDMTDE